MRRFNRVVTARVGALEDRFLARDRPLGEARVLWEIGPQGCEVRILRARLGLDSGYLSRLLRSLEGAGLVVVVVSRGDARVRTARLTPAGLVERALLDEGADALARSLLDSLAPSPRERLVAAMGEVERLLTSGLVEIAPVDPSSAAAAHCLQAYVDELGRRFPGGFDPSLSISARPADFTPPNGLLMLARLHGEPVGCGGLKFHDDAPAELKRMWIDPSLRGLGVGRRLLAELEAQAAAAGVRVLRLETNGALAEAIALYLSVGYVAVDAFNDDPYAEHWFEKQLGARDAGPRRRERRVSG